MTLVARARRVLRGIAARIPVLAEVAHRAEVIADGLTRAAAVDVRHARIALSPSWCRGLADADLEFVLAHELMHVVMRTGERGDGADAIYWNFAHDLVINQKLVELLGRPAPRGGVTLPRGLDLDAEAAYLRARGGGFGAQFEAWRSTIWQVDAHRLSSPALAKAGDGLRGVELRGARGVIHYVPVDHDPATAEDVRAAVIAVEPRRPWPVAWLDRLHASGRARARSWLRPSRRGEGPGRYRVGSDTIEVILDVTPAILPHAARYAGWLRAFATDLGMSQLRLISVDETGVVADREFDIAIWRELDIPRALVIQRSHHAELRDGTWTCTQCHAPHASPRPTTGDVALRGVDQATRARALVLRGR